MEKFVFQKSKFLNWERAEAWKLHFEFLRLENIVDFAVCLRLLLLDMTEVFTGIGIDFM